MEQAAGIPLEKIGTGQRDRQVFNFLMFEIPVKYLSEFIELKMINDMQDI